MLAFMVGVPVSETVATNYLRTSPLASEDNVTPGSVARVNGICILKHRF